MTATQLHRIIGRLKRDTMAERDTTLLRFLVKPYPTQHAQDN